MKKFADLKKPRKERKKFMLPSGFKPAVGQLTRLPNNWSLPTELS